MPCGCRLWCLQAAGRMRQSTCCPTQQMLEKSTTFCHVKANTTPSEWTSVESSIKPHNKLPPSPTPYHHLPQSFHVGVWLFWHKRAELVRLLEQRKTLASSGGKALRAAHALCLGKAGTPHANQHSGAGKSLTCPFFAITGSV